MGQTCLEPINSECRIGVESGHMAFCRPAVTENIATIPILGLKRNVLVVEFPQTAHYDTAGEESTTRIINGPERNPSKLIVGTESKAQHVVYFRKKAHYRRLLFSQ